MCSIYFVTVLKTVLKFINFYIHSFLCDLRCTSKHFWVDFTFSHAAYTDFQFWCVWVFNLPHFKYSDLLLDIIPTSLLQDLQDTWPVQKVSNLWPGKIHLHTWRSATLIPFEVVSLWVNTLLPVVPPLFEAFLESLFAMEYSLPIVFLIMSSRDSYQVPFSCVFRWRNSQK